MRGRGVLRRTTPEVMPYMRADVSAGILLLRFRVRIPFSSVCVVEVFRVLGADKSQFQVIAVDRACREVCEGVEVCLFR